MNTEIGPQSSPEAQPNAQPAQPPFDLAKYKTPLICVLAVFGVFCVVFACYYIKYARLIDRKLRGGAFPQSMNIYAAPVAIHVGDAVSEDQIAAHLRQNAYGPARSNTLGRYNVRPNAIEIFPGRDSYFGDEPAVVRFSGGRVAKIISLGDNTERTELLLEPQLITNISDRTREKRRIVSYSDLPRALVNAVVAAEDKRFFQHNGLDFLRIVKAAWVDLREGRKEQGASTLSMQLARNIWLQPEKSWRRKMAEMLITMHLEHKLSKEEIFEYYANQVYLGRRNTFSINGFGEASRAYFGKDVGQLNLPQAALLAGMVQRPSYYNPLRYPDRARERRNVVLALMRENGFINEAQYQQAANAPLQVSPAGDGDSVNAQYFIDLVNDELQSRLPDREVRGNRAYTTLDLALQRAAEEAVRSGMPLVDQQLKQRRKKEGLPPNQPQVALIALDPHTGAIKALVGGRDYRTSQLDHVLAQRQPGSAFKPFVYAAALNTAVEGGDRIFTPASPVVDAPTTFEFGNLLYTPGNFHNQFMGTVSLRTALAHSLNVATIRLAEAVGYGTVVNIAQRAGLASARPTPSVALGTYEATPLQVAGAYTVFANGGTYVKPSLLSMVRGPEGDILHSARPETRRALDPRVTYLMVTMLQEVMRSGTAAGVRSRGFTLPAAGKTGTSRDGWFAGFTSNLLCVVWVGFDDNRDLGLEGAHSALPIWADFMKRASQIRQYSGARPFPPPDGIVAVRICNESGRVATPYCSSTRVDAFIEGTQPGAQCDLHNSSVPYELTGADRLQPIEVPRSATVVVNPPPPR